MNPRLDLAPQQADAGTLRAARRTQPLCNIVLLPLVLLVIQNDGIVLPYEHSFLKRAVRGRLYLGACKDRFKVSQRPVGRRKGSKGESSSEALLALKAYRERQLQEKVRMGPLMAGHKASVYHDGRYPP